jgi:GxxExxY protein
MSDNFVKLIYEDLTYKINGIIFSIHNNLGRFCNEKQYSDALEEKFKEFKIGYKREEILPSSFKGELRGRNKVDFIIEDKIVLEIKAKRILEKENYYQVRRYLDALGKKLGLLVNFRQKMIQVKQILNSSVKE